MQDLKVMRRCYRDGHYGASAYHCQQALEKFAKFAVAKYHLLDDPGVLNHDILRGLLKKWRIGATPCRGWSSKALQVSSRMLDEVASGSRSPAARAAARAGDLTLRDVAWADSLRIPVPDPALDNIRSQLEPPPLSLLAEFLGRHFTKKAKNRILRAVRAAVDVADQEAVIAAAHRACVEIVWMEVQKRYKPHAGRKRLPPEIAEACLQLWLLANLDTVIMAIPHEEYGRYPGMLCGKPRTMWYAERSADLLALEESVQKAIYELYRMIKY